MTTSTTTVAPVGWFEIASSDPAASEAFYSSVFGWQFSPSPGIGDAYRIAAAGDGPAGGVTTAMDGLPADYAIFSIVVPDVDGACEQITALGGSVLFGPATVPDAGLRYANVADPFGNHFGIFTPPAND
jgi:predicted enzyme related to lactoylglutathione lyase